jgi:ribosomal protein S18 acetylase RimI-like enzyme
MESIDNGPLVLEHRRVPWDSEIFGFDVVQFSTIKAGNGNDAEAALECELDLLRRQGTRLAVCRLPIGNGAELALLQRCGFRVMETLLQPRFTDLARFALDGDCLDVAVAKQEDMTTVVEIAGTAFCTDRYHLDPQLPPGLADERYRVWARNALRNPAQTLLTLRDGDDIVGFFVVDTQPGGVRHWGLTAIAVEWQSRGCGKRAWRAVLARHHAEGVACVTSSISAANLPVLNLYSCLGARFVSAEVTLHLWL